MARRMKKRGLSGSPEHHRGGRDRFTSSSNRFFKQAAAEAKDDKCRVSLRFLMEAAEDFGQAEAHARETPGEYKAWEDRSGTHYADAVKAFEANCLKSGLSGLRRPRRRSR